MEPGCKLESVPRVPATPAGDVHHPDRSLETPDRRRDEVAAPRPAIPHTRDTCEPREDTVEHVGYGALRRIRGQAVFELVDPFEQLEVATWSASLEQRPTPEAALEEPRDYESADALAHHRIGPGGADLGAQDVHETTELRLDALSLLVRRFAAVGPPRLGVDQAGDPAEARRRIDCSSIENPYKSGFVASALVWRSQAQVCDTVQLGLLRLCWRTASRFESMDSVWDFANSLREGAARRLQGR